MNVSNVGAFSAPAQTLRSSAGEAAEGPGPDKVNDHDSDDMSSAKAPTAAGTGGSVDISV